ncbi:hypothetical protein ACO22_03886 [Paracoccidioides brasiliensis]|uniref:Uncharacterized protein n=1 Tax=Paracoccidioides brasiliensis TaxID=121759 RepID=A0A1D2JEV9_PARBR|nr:hypothetical protein ACO22_03886 [Paracoccidioides brasiliensis]
MTAQQRYLRVHCDCCRNFRRRTCYAKPRNPRKLRKHQPECVGLSGILFLSIHGGRQIYKLRSPYSTRKRRKLRQKLGHVFLTPRKSP